MNVQRAARWSGSGICNGRLRLGIPRARYYSFHANKPSTIHCGAVRCSQNTLRKPNLQQTRSISIFGWGSSASPKPDEFTTAHAPRDTPWPRGAPDAAMSSPTPIQPTRSVKASHATSDTPDPSTSITTELPHTPEPAALKHLENVIAEPGGHAPEVSNTIAQIAEYKGYLKEVCGLDYGWGPTAFMENILETIHIYGSQSWTVSIIGVAIVYRAITAIFVYRGADQSAKMKEMMPVLQPIKDEMQKASLMGDMAKRQQLSAEMQALNKEIGLSPVKLFLPILVQIPLGFGGFRLLRGCATAPVPAFLNESWLWNVDLTMSDPYYALPALQGLMLFFAVRMSQKAGIQVLSGGMGMFLMVGLPAVSVIWSTFQPGSVQLFFLTSTAIATLQSWALSKNGFRRAIGLMEMPGSMGTTPPARPAGLRRMPDPAGGRKVLDVKATTSTPTPVRSQNRSFIDKMVDSAKAKREQLKGGVWNTTVLQANEKAQTRKKAAELEKADKYEFMRREQLEHERASKTRMQQSPTTTIGPGGMRIMQKKDTSRR